MADDGIVALDVRQRDCRIPVCEAGTEADAELIRVRGLDLVVDQVHLMRGGVDRNSRQACRRQVAGIPEVAVVGRIHVGRRRTGAERIVGERRREVNLWLVVQTHLGRLVRELAEQVAVVGPAIAAEDHVLLIRLDVVRESNARLKLIGRRTAIRAGADVVADVDSRAARERGGEKLRISRRGAVGRLVRPG